MKLKIVIDEACEEEVIIYAKKKSELIDKIEQLVIGSSLELLGYLNKEVIKIKVQDVYCFIAEDSKVYAITKNDKVLLKYRLYNLEELLDESFVKINQSCIANINKIAKFDTSISGTLKVVFKNNYSDYVSRRMLKNIKEKVGLNR